MPRAIRYAAALFVLVMPCALPAADAPQQVSASYNWLLNGLHVAEMKETFQARDNNYNIISESNAVGILALFRKDQIVFTSNGLIVSDGLRPQRFEGQRDGRTEVRAEFEWAIEKLRLVREGQDDVVALPSGTQDRLSAMYQFMFWPVDKLKSLDFAMTNGRKIEKYRYDITPNVELETPLGRMSTLHLVKRQEPNDNRVEVWVSPRHHYLPVKVLIVERNGTRQEQIVTRLEITESRP